MRTTAIMMLTSGVALASGVHAAELTMVQSLQQGSTLVTVDSAAPSTVLRSVALSGLPVGARLIGFDARPAAGSVLYGLANTGQLYVINGITGVATSLGAPLALGQFPAHSGFDFNPTVDRIRIVTDANQNLRVNPDNGAVAATDPNVAYRAGDSGAGLDPAITGAAYTNNVAGATSTVLYLIDTNRAVLVTQGSVDGSVGPNTGQLFTVGALGLATNATSGFDISRTGEIVALLTDNAGAQALYRVNLATGAATRIGGVPGGPVGAAFTGIAFSQTPFGLIGGTANQTAVGGVLDRFAGIPSAGLLGLLRGLDGLPDDVSRNQALSDLSPAAFSLLPDLVFQTADFQDTTVRRYLRDVRGGGTDDRDDTAVLGAERRIGMFLVANGRYGDFDADIDRNRTKFSYTGLTGGVDYRITPDILIGVMGGYDLGEARLNRSSQQSDVDTWYAGGYATAASGPFYVDVHGSYGKTDFDLTRTVNIGGFSATTRATPESENWSAAGTIGGSFQFGGFEVEPYAGARYVRVKLDDFSESGDGTTALTVIARDRVESLQSILGLRIGGSIPVLGATLRPSIRGEWRREFENDASRFLVANFAGAGISAPFGFTTTPLDRDFAAVGAGFTVSGNSALSLVVDYNGQFGKDRQVNGITGGLRLAF